MKSGALNLFKLLCLPVIFLQSCSQEIGYWKNNQIKDSRRDEMHAMNDAIFKTVADDDDKTFGNYLSAELLQDYYRNKLFASIQGVTRKDKFELFNEFYVVNKYLGADTIAVKDGSNSFKLIYQGDPQEMYIATFLPKSKAPNQYMISLFYGKYNYGWKIKDIDVAPYRINGKTAPELYIDAKKLYAQKDIFGAANLMQIAQSCSRPNNTWQYDAETDLYRFAGDLIAEVNGNYKFPVKFNSIGTKPAIFRIYNATLDEGTFPNICYLTKISLKDEAALQRENDAMRAQINTLLPGVEKGNKYIVYSAYHEMPNPSAVVDHYDIKVKGQ